MILKNQNKKDPVAVVLIGGTGFIGRNLAQHLDEMGVETKITTSKEIDLTDKKSTSNLKELIKKDDCVVFLSALTPDKGKDTATMMKNLTMAQNLAETIEQLKFEHFVIVSSDAVYADDTLPEPVVESSATAPTTLYGCMHLARELIMKTATTKANIPTLTIRPCAVYGSGDTHNSYGPNRFLRTALKEKKIALFGEGEEKRDHIYVDDLSRLIALGLQHKSHGVINGVSGSSYSFMQVAQEIKELVGHDVNIQTQPRASAITHRHYNVTDRIKVFPQFQPTPLKTGLKNFLKELKK